MSKLTGKVALVTGGSRGIGAAIAKRLAADGATLAITYAKDASAASAVVKAIELGGGKAVAIQADATNVEAVKGAVEKVVATFGRLDVLVNNAGVAPETRTDILEATEESFDRLINVGVKGPYFLTQLAARWMVEQAQAGVQPAPFKPKIITISSISAYAASTNRGDYCLAKAALSMLTPLYAARLAEYGINAYEIRPGIIATDMTAPVKARYDQLISQGLTPIKRWGTPEDVGRAVAAIVQDLLPFSTGEVLNVDGGFHLRRL